jgi:NAD+ synthase (glutamine-hydrolysing)
MIQCGRRYEEIVTVTRIVPMKAGLSKVRIALAQTNPTVGDLEGNVRIIRRTIAHAKRLGVQLLAFPELMICGYPPEDLLLKPRFLDECEAALGKAARSARGIAVIVGSPEPPSSPGAAAYNTACVLYRGRVRARYRKIHLPNYGVFDEKRYFEPGERAIVVRFGDLAVGISICEDIWADDGPTGDQVVRGGARVVVNISASPYHRRKGPERERLMKRRAKENGVFLCYANLLGGQDELVFDGSSVIADPRGKTIARGRPFEEDLIVADIPLPAAASGRSRRRATPRRASAGGPGRPIETITLPPLPEPGMKPAVRRRAARHPKPDEEVYKALVMGTRDYVNKNKFKVVVLGLSGGIDSALTAAVAVDALSSDRVKGITMPSTYTSGATLRDARRLAENLGIELYEVPIGGTYQSYIAILESAFAGTAMDVTEENIQARIRGNLLMAFSNKFGWLVLATGNKSEIAVGYCTLYGDTAGGFAVLRDVPKTLVYTLCRYRNRIAGGAVIPSSTIRRRPTAELRPGQFDEDTLPAYRVLDRIIELYVERDMSFDEIVASGLDRDTVRRTLRMIDRNEYKRRQAPPGIKITPKAFGRDRRLPITNRFRAFD